MDKKQQVMKRVYVVGVDNNSCYLAPYYDNKGTILD